MLPVAYENFPDDAMYNADCSIINKLTWFVGYNYKSTGYNGPYTNTLYDGNVNTQNPDGIDFSYSMYNNGPLKKNNYNYFELAIPLEKLKMKGSTKSYKL